MIASQKIGKSFMGALNYNWKKLGHPDVNCRAELLESNFTTLDRLQISREVNLIRELRPNLNKYVYHTSLNFSKEEDALLNNEKMLLIAHDYLRDNGFTNNQYLVFRHHDAGHPHLHLLVNRIRFDGTVVSDSNNYRKSEEILRRLEERYNLIAVEPSKKASQRAAGKDELEMVIRTRQPSEKMLLQEKVKRLIRRGMPLSSLISMAAASGVHLLFNQASTGRVTGITYFHNDFKIKGQSLGNRFKWAELIKIIDYDQIRDSQAIGEANSRTRAIYGGPDNAAGQQTSNRPGSDRLYTSRPDDTGSDQQEQSKAGQAGAVGGQGTAGTLAANPDVDIYNDHSVDHSDNYLNGFTVEIADDEDDAKYRRRNRRMGR